MIINRTKPADTMLTVLTVFILFNDFISTPLIAFILNGLFHPVDHADEELMIAGIGEIGISVIEGNGQGPAQNYK